MKNVVEITRNKLMKPLVPQSELSEIGDYFKHNDLTENDIKLALTGQNKATIVRILIIPEYPKVKKFNIKRFWDYCLKIAPYSKNAYVSGAVVHLELEVPIVVCNAHDLYELQMQFDKALWFLKEMSEFEYRFVLSPNSNVRPGRTALHGLPGYR